MTHTNAALTIYRNAPTEAAADRVFGHVVRTAYFDGSGGSMPWPQAPANDDEAREEDDA